MARTKLSPEQKEELKKQEAIAHAARSLESGKKELVERVEWGFIKAPTRQFEIGEEVENGAHDHTVIADKDLDGTIYRIEHKYVTPKDTHGFRRAGQVVDSSRWVAWQDVFKKRTPEELAKIPRFEPVDDVRFNYSQQTISSFHSLVYYFGMDLNPDYQRELVWDLEDKLKLVDSIFSNVDIGKFAFIRRSYDRTGNSTPHLYEILDGKQRLSTIIEFMEDRFKWRGFFYSELHNKDQWHFDNYKIAVAETDNMSKEQIYRYFLKLNTGGKPIATEHLDKIEALLKKEQEKK